MVNVKNIWSTAAVLFIVMGVLYLLSLYISLVLLGKRKGERHGESYYNYTEGEREKLLCNKIIPTKRIIL